ncbi:hypothetical protein BJV82DRAFT_663873 [Fennellomyces sp. T-0311]|nr:hypothetical protein BJV82DRAFT_663873 [Fennellomyces sp. T-0311]
MAQCNPKQLLLTAAYHPGIDGQKHLDIVFQRLTDHIGFNTFTARAILEELKDNFQTADRNLLCQFIIDMIREELPKPPSSHEISSVNYHLLFTFVKDLLRDDLCADIQKQLPYTMRHQINDLLIQYKSQTEITQENFVEKYLPIQYLGVIEPEKRTFLPSFPIVIWLNKEMDRNICIDTPQRCLRRAFCFRKLTSIRWYLGHFFAHLEYFRNRNQFRRMVNEVDYFRNLPLVSPLTMRNGDVVENLGELIDYLQSNNMDDRVQLRVSQLKEVDRYRLELLYLGDFEAITRS